MKKKCIFIIAMFALCLTACGQQTGLTPSASEMAVVGDAAEENGGNVTNVQVVETPKVSEVKIVDEAKNANSNGHVVVLDPGHQLKQNDEKEANAPGSSVMKKKVTSGVTGVKTGKKEYELNLEIGLALRDELEARGYTVYMTRENHDVDLSNQERTKFATEKNADILIHIHADGHEDASIHGSGVLAPTKDNQYVGNLAKKSITLGEDILECYCEKTGIRRRGVLSGDDMTGINFSTVPVVIMEMGFLTNEGDDTFMAQVDNQILMVQGIADGVDKYFK